MSEIGSYLVLVPLAIGANSLIGICVLDSIDDKQRRVFTWWCACPREIAWFAQPLVLNLWPVFLIMWGRHRRSR